MYNFEQPVIMKVCGDASLKPAEEEAVYRRLTVPFPCPSSGLRASAAAGADPSGRRLLGQNPEGVPAHETHAGPQPDHGGPAEVPTMPHGRQAVGHVGVRLRFVEKHRL